METKLVIKGMTCGHCVGAVEKALAGVPGVAKVIGVSIDPGWALVQGGAEPEKLIAAVAGEGFEARVA